MSAFKPVNKTRKKPTARAGQSPTPSEQKKLAALLKAAKKKGKKP
jgi:hypothetical protein